MVDRLSAANKPAIERIAMSFSSNQPTGADEEIPETTGAGSRVRVSLDRMPLVAAAAAVLVFVGLAFLALSLSGRDQRPLYPVLATATLPGGTPDFEPVEIGFSELNSDPEAFLGRRLQVTGAYSPVKAPDCPSYTGLLIRWSLVAEELQLNATGFEALLRLVEPGTEMTVVGIWSAYRGPVGCGKEPDDATVWYLQVERIVTPNPLFGASGAVLTIIPGEPLPTLPPLDAAATASPDLSATITISGTMTPTVTIQTTDLPGLATPSIETTGLPVTPLATAGSPTVAAGTPALGTPATSVGTPTAGPSPTPSATGGVQGTTTPGIPTTTPPGTGYPSQPTPPGGYP